MALNYYYPQDEFKSLDTEVPFSWGKEFGEMAGSSWESLSPFRMTDELQAQARRQGLQPDSPFMAPWYVDRPQEKVSVDDANKEGEQYGLRYSEPQYRAALDYDIEHKRKEARTQEVLSRSPGYGAATAAQLAVGLFDPINAPLMAVGLGEAREAQLALALGSKTAGRAVAGAASGSMGMAALTPLNYAYAQSFQDQYGASEALADIVFGAKVGGIGHPLLGKVGDWGAAYQARATEREAAAQREQFQQFWRDINQAYRHPGEKEPVPAAGHPGPAEPEQVDLRKARSRIGEIPYIVDALDPEVRDPLMEAATRAVADGKFPDMEALLKLSPEADPKLMWSSKYPAQIRIRNSFDTPDFYDTSTKPARMIERDLQRRIRGEEGHPAEALFKHFQGIYPELAETKFDLVPPEEYDRNVAHGNETGAIDVDPRQRAYYDQERNEFVASADTTLGQLHHQIQAHLDDRQGFHADPAERGGYRITRDDFAAAKTVRKADLENSGPQTAGRPSPADQLEKFANSPDIGVTPVDRASAQRISDTINRDKDKDLDTLMGEEEEVARETVQNLAAQIGRDGGNIERILSPEDRELLEPKVTVEEALNEAQAIADEMPDAKQAGRNIVALYHSPELLDAFLKDRIGRDQAFGIVNGVEDVGEHARILSRIEAEAKDNVARQNAIIAEEARAAAERQKAALDEEGLAEDQAEPVQASPAETRMFPEPRPGSRRDAFDAIREDNRRGVQKIPSQEQAAELLARLERYGEEAVREAARRLGIDDTGSVKDVLRRIALSDEFDYSIVKIWDLVDELEAERGRPWERGPQNDEAELNAMEEKVVLDEMAELKETKKLAKLVSKSQEALFNEAAARRARIESLDAFRGGQEDTQTLDRPRDPSEAGHPETALGQARPTDGWVGRLAPGASDGGAPSFGRRARSVEQNLHATHRIITPDGSMEVNAVPMIVERGDLHEPRGALRGRGKRTADVTAIAQNLDPEQLGEIVVTNDGAIISGKARTAALGKAYEWAAEGKGGQADAYRFGLGEGAHALKEPVLVHVLADDLSHEDLASLAERFNRPRLEMTDAASRAASDAKAAGADVMADYAGGKLDLKRNQPFVDRFLMEVSRDPVTEGLRDADGALTKVGEARVNAALMHAAYGDPATMAALLESSDRQVKRFAGALRDVAADFLNLKSYISAGFVDPRMDISPYITEAAKIVHRYRYEGKDPAGWLTDTDPLDRRDRMVELLVRSFYDDDGKPVDRAEYADVLRAYAKKATKTRPLLPGAALSGIEREGSRYVIRDRDGDVVASAQVSRLEKTGSVSPVWVHDSLRRQGIASRLYDRIEADLAEEGRTLTPSGTLKDDGFKFWQKRNPEAVAHDLRAREAEVGAFVAERHGKDASFSVRPGGDSISVFSEEGDHLADYTRRDIDEAGQELAQGAEGVRERPPERGGEESGQPAPQSGEPNGADRNEPAGPGANDAAAAGRRRRKPIIDRGEPVENGPEPALDFSRPANAFVRDFLDALGDKDRFLEVYNRASEEGKLSRDDLKRVYYALTGELPGKKRVDTLLQGIEAVFKKASAESDVGGLVKQDALARLAEVQKTLPRKQVEGVSEFAAQSADRLRASKDIATWNAEVEALKKAKRMSKPELQSLAHEMLGEPVGEKLTKAQVWERIQEKAPAAPAKRVEASEALPATEEAAPVDESRAEERASAPAPEPAKPAFSTEARDKLFDMIDDKKPVKGVLQLARELGVSHDEASALIDHMIDYGWLRYVEKPNGDVDLRAVSVKDRPVRPVRGGRQEMASLSDGWSEQELPYMLAFGDSGATMMSAVKGIRELGKTRAAVEGEDARARKQAELRVKLIDQNASWIARDWGVTEEGSKSQYADARHDPIRDLLVASRGLKDALAEKDWAKFDAASAHLREAANRMDAFVKDFEEKTRPPEQRPFEFANLTPKEFAERLKSDPAGLRALADADPMVRESLDPEIQDRLMAIDRALGVRYSLRDDNERTSRVSGALARAGAGEVRRQAGAQRIGYPAGGPHQPSEKPFVFPGYRAHFEELAPVYDGYGNVWRARRYSAYGKGRDPVATMLVSQASDGRGHVDWVKAKGLGAKFYQAVADHFGVNIRPSGILFEDGYKFWLRHDPEAVKHHIQDELGDYHSPSDILIRLREAQRDNNPVGIDLYQKLWDKLSPEAQASANPNETMFSLRDQPLAIPHPDPLREASAIKVRDAIDKAAEKAFPDSVQWRFMDSLRDNRAKWANGIWNPRERLVEIASDIRNGVETVWHEAVHVYRTLGSWTQAEWNILEKAAVKNGWIERIDAAEYAKRYGGNQDALLEEAIAKRIGEWMAGNDKPKTAVEMLFDRFKRFFEAIGSWMDGHGFKSHMDLFKAVRRGDLADRPVVGEVRGGGYSQGDLIKMMKDNNRAPEEDPALMGEARARAAEALANCMVR